jgi:glycosyltransferase involved in cell wall biosynthesis
VKVAYVVSRFPLVTETFLLREFSGVDREPDITVELLSLFPGEPEALHAEAQRWMPRLRHPGPRAAVAGLLHWSVVRPLALGRLLLAVLRDYGTAPRLLVQALVTLAVASAHARDIRRDPVDHLHACYASYSMLAAWIIASLCDVPFSFTAHAHDVFLHQRGLARRSRSARFIIAISDFNADFLRRYAGPDVPIEEVRYGLDLERFPFRARTFPAAGPVRGVCIAGLREYKGHRWLLEALAGDAELGRVHLRLVGDGPLRGELEQRVAALGLGDRVTFAGSLSQEDLAAELERADFLVLPSIVARDGNTEGLPNALIEGMAVGLPVVSTRVTGIPELVVDGATGLLAEPGDAASTADALRRLLADPGAAEQRARAGRAAVERDHDLRQTVARMAALFRRQA